MQAPAVDAGEWRTQPCNQSVSAPTTCRNGSICPLASSIGESMDMSMLLFGLVLALGIPIMANKWLV